MLASPLLGITFDCFRRFRFLVLHLRACGMPLSRLRYLDAQRSKPFRELFVSVST